MLVKDSKGIIIGSLNKIKMKIKELNGKLMGTVERLNPYGDQKQVLNN